MIDEDAFGMLFSYFDVEDDEYGCDDRSEFVRRFQAFEDSVIAGVEKMDLPRDHHLVCFGHAVYVELRDEVGLGDLLRHVRVGSQGLGAQGFTNVALLTHGSRWVEPDAPPLLSVAGEMPRIARISRPSEPLRRALNAAALACSDDDVEGWGPGVYADTEALEALGKAPKNAPTVLHSCGARFYRIPPLKGDGK